MKNTVTQSDFHDAFHETGRGSQFTHDGREALFNYLEAYEDDTGEEIELDVIALCCDYAEYANLEEFQQDYDAEDYKTIEDIGNSTTVIPVDDERFIIQAF